MNDSIYVSKKESVSAGNNSTVVLGAIIIILLLIFGILFLLQNFKTNSTDNSAGNSNATATPTVSANANETPAITESPSPTTNPSPTVTPTGTPIKLYFYKSPIKPMQDTNEIYAVDRYTEDTNLIPIAIKEFFKGPSAPELTAGYILPFTLSGDSTCSGSNYKFSYNVPTLKLTICRQIDPTPESGDGGSYAGSSLKAMARVLKVITTSLKVSGITKVEVYDKSGVCYAPDSGQNSCQ